VKWLRRILGLEWGVYVSPTPVGSSHEEWLQSLLEELRTPSVERELAARDMDVLLTSGRMRVLIEPFTPTRDR
jgi:hypothetical protein